MHSCPLCGLACYCDIEVEDVGDELAEDFCSHCGNDDGSAFDEYFWEDEIDAELRPRR